MERINRPEYKFTKSGTLIFMTGVPLSGKSTLAPLIASSVEGCVLQNMDIIRLLAQEVDSLKPEEQRNPFVNYGSCDSYGLTGDGSYTPKNLIDGFNAYSKAITSLLDKIIPKLEVQGAQNVLFEGVQLVPSLVSPYLKGNNCLVIITANQSRLENNRYKMFGEEAKLLERYSVDKLMLLQEEIIAQSKGLRGKKFFVVDNSDNYLSTISIIIQNLLKLGILEKKTDE